MHRAYSFLLDLFFPPKCLCCLKHLAAGTLCDACRAGVKINETTFCGECMARMPSAVRACHPGHPYILAAASDYSEPAVQALIQGLKFKGVRGAAEPLGNILSVYAGDLNIEPRPGTLVVPVPLSEPRRRERGFNQAELLAGHLARRFSLPVVDALVRTRHSPPQSGLGSSERAGNVAGAFRASAGLDGRPVWLVDDVATSGSTLREAATALRSAGARNVIAWVVAKA